MTGLKAAPEVPVLQMGKANSLSLSPSLFSLEGTPLTAEHTMDATVPSAGSFLVLEKQEEETKPMETQESSASPGQKAEEAVSTPPPTWQVVESPASPAEEEPAKPSLGQKAEESKPPLMVLTEKEESKLPDQKVEASQISPTPQAEKVDESKASPSQSTVSQEETKPPSSPREALPVPEIIDKKEKPLSSKPSKKLEEPNQVPPTQILECLPERAAKESRE